MVAGTRATLCRHHVTLRVFGEAAVAIDVLADERPVVSAPVR